MKIKVCDAPIEVLNYLVAKIERHEWRCPWLLEKEGYVAWQSYEQAWGNPTPDYCSNWDQGGPIIEREGGTLWSTNAVGWRCKARYDFTNDKEGVVVGGPTPLIAAMRCFVASKLGDVVDIPDELCE